MNSLYLLTSILRTCIYINVDIEDLAIRGKEYSEVAGRNEVNMIDMLFAVNDVGQSKENIVNYLRETKIKYRFAKQVYLQRIKETEENERIALIRKINMNNVLITNSIPQNLLDAIPRPLRIFPRDFAQKETQITMDPTEEMKKQKTMIKSIEKKSLEEIISSNTYYDLSKKHNKRKSSVDINHLFSDIVKTENINLGKKFKSTSKIDKELVNLKKDELFPICIFY
jgi:hypothetical protein